MEQPDEDTEQQKTMRVKVARNGGSSIFVEGGSSDTQTKKSSREDTDTKEWSSRVATHCVSKKRKEGDKSKNRKEGDESKGTSLIRSKTDNPDGTQSWGDFLFGLVSEPLDLAMHYNGLSLENGSPSSASSSSLTGSSSLSTKDTSSSTNDSPPLAKDSTRKPSESSRSRRSESGEHNSGDQVVSSNNTGGSSSSAENPDGSKIITVFDWFTDWNVELRDVGKEADHADFCPTCDDFDGSQIKEAKSDKTNTPYIRLKDSDDRTKSSPKKLDKSGGAGRRKEKENGQGDCVAECPICFDGLNLRSAVMRCKTKGKPHYFHARCLQEWIASSRSQMRKPTCPICRQDVEFNKKNLRFFLDKHGNSLPTEERGFFQRVLGSFFGSESADASGGSPSGNRNGESPSTDGTDPSASSSTSGANNDLPGETEKPVKPKLGPRGETVVVNGGTVDIIDIESDEDIDDSWTDEVDWEQILYAGSLLASFGYGFADGFCYDRFFGVTIIPSSWDSRLAQGSGFLAGFITRMVASRKR